MKKSFFFALLLMLGTSATQAQHALNSHETFKTPLRASAVITKSNPAERMQNAGAGLQKTSVQKSDVFLMNISLTNEQRRKLSTFQVNSNVAQSSQAQPLLPSRVELGMNNVPVLDQGMHGSCVVFANTGALNALLGKGDYISQLCHLAVGSYLEERGYTQSGWDGSFGPLVLDRLSEFGIVSLATQRTKTCGKLSEYPLNEMDNIGDLMSLDDYSQISEDISNDFYWYSLLTPYERFAWNSPVQSNRVLLNVKKALAERNAQNTTRLTFGVSLPIEHCSAGACAKYHKADDTWAITNDIRKSTYPEFGGHEMIITGYDDDAIAIDNEGTKHQGLLILRNSWSDRHGDNGNYYMTYEFFKQYVTEVQKIKKYA